MGKVVCSWCETVNDGEAGSCLACGAPIVKPSPEPPASITNSTRLNAAPPKDFTTQDLVKAGETADKLYTGAINAYALVWRTLGEALAIGVAAFILGLAGGATRQAGLGILAGIVLGILVGATTKNFWLTILGAPLGALLGAFMWLLPWALGAGVRGALYSAFGLGMLGAWVGKRSRTGPKNRYEKLRPWLGAAGGLLFASLGTLLGLGLDWVAGAVTGGF